MQYAPTDTDQKFDSYVSDESKTRYVLGHMQYAPTDTDQKSDSYLLDESETCQVFWCMSLRPTKPRRETPKICMITYETRRKLGGCGRCHANSGESLLKFVCVHVKPGGDWTNMAIFTRNPARIG